MDVPRTTTDFDDLANPFPLIASCVLGWAILLGILARGRIWPMEALGVTVPLTSTGVERTVLLLYLGIYLSWWFVYLVSARMGGIRSLRALLHMFAFTWSREDIEGSVSRTYEKKAQASIGAMSIMAAAAVIGIDVSFSQWVQTPGDDTWKQAMGSMALAAAAGGFVSFLLAADALDSLLNDFPDRVAVEIRTSLYGHAVSRRYVGFALVLLQFALVAAIHSPLTGAGVIAVILALGHTYWFPSMGERRAVFLWGLLLATVLLVPILFAALARSEDSLPKWTYLLSSILLWGFSAQFLRVGLTRLPRESAEGGDMAALAIALTYGLLTQIAIMLYDSRIHGSLGDWTASMSAGTLALFFGTLIYLRHAPTLGTERNRLPVNSGFKPVLASLAAITLFRESLDPAMHFSLALLVIAVIARFSGYRARAWKISFVGLAVAFLWTLGEVLLLRPFDRGTSSQDAALATLTATALAILFALFNPRSRGVLFDRVLDDLRCIGSGARRPMGSQDPHRWRGYVALYGITSVGLAFPTYLIALREYGLLRSSLATAGWPIVAMGLAYVFARADGRESTMPPRDIAIVVLLVLGGVIAFSSIIFGENRVLAGWA